MRTLRRWLREILIRIPFGERIVLPRIRSIYDRLPFYVWRKKRYAASEVKSLLSAMSSGIKSVTLVYDCETSACSYGAVINFLSIARFVNAHELPINIYFVDSSTIADTDNDLRDMIREVDHYKRNEVNDIIQDSMAMVTVLLDEPMRSVNRIASSSLPSVLSSLDNSYILFEDFTRTRRPVFRDLWNVYCKLMAKSSRDMQDRILYSSSEFVRWIPESFEVGQYVSWHCRYSHRGSDFGRQTFPVEFAKIYNHLRERFPDHEILIVSDDVGCKYYNALANRLEIDNLLFSKDYSNDFLGDAAMIMNSDFFFCFRGGGIAQIPLTSKLPYEFYSPDMDENMWNPRKMSPWQTDSQNWVLLKKHQFDESRERNLDTLGSFRYGSG